MPAGCNASLQPRASTRNPARTMRSNCTNPVARHGAVPEDFLQTPKGHDMTRIRHRRPLALAAALFLASTVAVAAPGGPGGPGPRGGAAGPGAPGPGGPGVGPGMVEHVLEGLKDKLALDGAQQSLFDAARAQTLAARDRMVASRNDVRAKVESELAKPDPDLAAVAALFESAEEQSRALRHQTRDQWLKLYASLRADQKLVVRDELKARFDRMETMRERMKERRGPKPS